MKDDEYPFGCTLEEMDIEAFFNMRDWLQRALEAAGAKKIGGGMGMGGADLDIELDGMKYFVTIKPIPKK